MLFPNHFVSVMWRWLILPSSLAACTQAAFAPAPIRWGGANDQSLVLASIPSSMSAASGAQMLTITDLTVEMSPSSIPYFTAKPDSTIAWEAKGLCIEATGMKSGDAVNLNHCTSGKSQRWNWLPWGLIQLKGTNQCIDVAKNGDAVGALIVLTECENAAASRWKSEEPNVFVTQGLLDRAAPSRHVIAASVLVMLWALALGAHLLRQQIKPRVVARNQECFANEGGIALSMRGSRASFVAFSSMRAQRMAPAVMALSTLDEFNDKIEGMRLEHLERQAMAALKTGVKKFNYPVFANALIASDVVITHLLHRLGYLSSGKVKVFVVDTFHLFPETLEFLKEVEASYDFNSEIFCAAGVPRFDKKAFDEKYGANLWKENPEQYDKVCKVEPFQRGLKALSTDCLVTGRTRWQGNDRSFLPLFENAPDEGRFAKINPMAYWTFEDTFNYFRKHRIRYHPLHERGYPSIGDAKDTIPVPADGSVVFKNYEFQGDKKQWLRFACERKGRFVDLTDKDGSTDSKQSGPSIPAAMAICPLDVDNDEMVGMRLEHLEEQAMEILTFGVENFEHVAFPNAMVAGDVVITHLLHRMNYLRSEKVKIIVIDTFHLFPETLEFLSELESQYGFKAEIFCAKGVPCFDKATFDKKYGANLWKDDIERYDQICKVEPFERGLKELGIDCLINGRTRWHGSERHSIRAIEDKPFAGASAKSNPLAFWTLEDIFNYIKKYRVPYHPLHEQGYPSIGDTIDTVQVPEDGSVRFKDYAFQGDERQWLCYACERKGRFVGLAHKDAALIR